MERMPDPYTAMKLEEDRRTFEIIFKEIEASRGYHLKDIPRGEYGKLSKILEEVNEAIDAEDQKNPVMVLVELSDLIGAIEGYLEESGSSIRLEDLVTMARATKRAFLVGERK